MRQLNILVLGAAYGLLPAMRILKAGHRTTIVCREEEQSALVNNGALVSFRGTHATGELCLAAQARRGISFDGKLGVCNPDINVSNIDLVILAMSEPYFAAPEISALIGRIAATELPVLAITNTPPPAFLERLGNIPQETFKDAYDAWDTWQCLDPSLVTAASPDAQAVRKNPSRLNELTVTLGSNFKVAPFEKPEHQDLLNTLSRDLKDYRLNGQPCRVQIVSHRSMYAPLAKWPMLLTGNCRCLKRDGRMVPISEAVHADLEESERIYEWGLELVQRMGADMEDLVPFRHYAAVSKRLKAPSSYARSIVSRSGAIERVDKMIQLSGRALGMSLKELDDIVELAGSKVMEHAA